MFYKGNINESLLTDEELWNWCLLEYKSDNFIVKRLINNYYKKIEKVTKLFKVNYKILEVGCGAAESSDRIRSFIGNIRFEISDYDERYIRMIKKNKPYFKDFVIQESVYCLKRKDN